MSKKQQLPESTEDVAELRALLEAKEARIAALELLVDKFRIIAYARSQRSVAESTSRRNCWRRGTCSMRS